MPTNLTLSTTISTRPICHVKRLASEAGSHFFDPEAMRFFASRVGQSCYTVNLSDEVTTWNGDGSSLVGFVTSEQFRDYRTGHAEPRLYTARVFRFSPVQCDDGRTRLRFDEVGGDFQAHRSAAAARSEVYAILHGLTDAPVQS